MFISHRILHFPASAIKRCLSSPPGNELILIVEAVGLRLPLKMRRRQIKMTFKSTLDEIATLISTSMSTQACEPGHLSGLTGYTG